jgi:LmbE family N-acetylglucosaminyl deacetylase
MKMTEAQLLGKRLAFVIAHPDDESFLAAGTIDKNHHAGGENFIICATLGERGKARLGQKFSGSQLRKMRANELEAVCSLLHVNKHLKLGLPDGSVKENTTKLSRLVNQHLKKIKPEIIFSFGLDGVTGHKDHITVGTVAKKYARQMKLPFAAFVVPSSWHATLLKRRKHGRYIAKLTSPKPNLVVKIKPKIKLAAIKLHASQVNKKNPLADFPPAVKRDMLRQEYFLIQN